MCGEERPENYKVPDIYQPDPEETIRIQQEELAMIQYEQVTRKAPPIWSTWSEMTMLESLKDLHSLYSLYA